MRTLGLLSAVAFCLSSSFALAQDVDWSKAFRFRTIGGFQNPGVIVGFNPQPEPPLYKIPPEIDLSEPTELRMIIPDIAVSEGGAQIVFAVPEEFFIEADGAPVGQLFSFQAVGPSPIDVQFNMSTGSGGIALPGSWVSFNPQPEPPAGWIGMGFEFQFSSNSPATLVVEMVDDGVEPLAFELLPAGDFDEDGDIDNRDLKIWEENFGTGALGDANFNGQTGGDDFAIWQRQYTGPKEITGVPEPQTLLLILAGGVAYILLPIRRAASLLNRGE